MSPHPVQQLSFNELLSHLASAHEREISDLRSDHDREVKLLRCSQGSASSGSCDVLDMSSFPSRQPTLATMAGLEDSEPTPELTETIMDMTADLVRESGSAGQGLASHREISEENLAQRDRSLRKQTGPDAKALACALQIARTLGLSAISEDHTADFGIEDDELLFRAGVSQTAEVDRGTNPLPVVVPGRPPHSLPQVNAPNPIPSFMPASPLDDHEPLPEEDKSVLQGASDNSQGRNMSRPRRHNFPIAAGSAIPVIPDIGREWSLDPEKTGDAAATLNTTVNPGLDSGLGLSSTSAIWLEATDSIRDPRSPSQAGSPSHAGDSGLAPRSPSFLASSSFPNEAAEAELKGYAELGAKVEYRPIEELGPKEESWVDIHLTRAPSRIASTDEMTPATDLGRLQRELG